MTETTRTTVGVVIPCKDEGETIARCLRALRDQTHEVHRIVVVDNGSTDGSDEIAARHAEVLRYDGKGIARVRNAGARQLTDCDVIGFVDADCEVGPRWVESGLEALADARLVGARTQAPADATWVARRWAAIEEGQQHDGSLLWSQHLMMRRETFEQLGGFDEELATGEDNDLSRRVIESGGRLAHVPGMQVVHHGFAPTLRGFVRRESWHTSTPGWFGRMSAKSQAMVLGAAGWSVLGVGALGAALTGRPRPVLGWAGATAAAVPALGYVAGRSPRHAVQDGVLMWAWALTRAGHLTSELPALATSRR